ncbi:MAG: hypothetical protein VX185_10720 [Pseudomonadota bacterium]|nr:hypothetical protein [Pseudomonadota bacterium]
MPAITGTCRICHAEVSHYNQHADDNRGLMHRLCAAEAQSPRGSSDLTMVDTAAEMQYLMDVQRAYQQQHNQNRFIPRLDSVWEMSGLYQTPAAPAYHVDHSFFQAQENTSQRAARLEPKEISTEQGYEVDDVLRLLNKSPTQSHTFKYLGSEAIDTGGVTRQVYNNALNQHLSRTQILKGSPLQVNTQNVTLKAAYDLGLLLGKIAKIKMAVDVQIHPSFYEQVQKASQLLNNEDYQNIKRANGGLAQLNQLNNEDIIKLCQIFEPKLYNDKASTDMLLEMAKDNTLKPYFFNSILSFIHTAEAINATDAPALENGEALREAIEGEHHLVNLMPKAFTARASGIDQATTSHYDALHKESLQKFNKQELTQLCKALTGSSGLVKGDKLWFSVSNEPSTGVFKAQSCSKDLIFYAKPFESLFIDHKDADQKQLFQALLKEQLDNEFNDI